MITFDQVSKRHPDGTVTLDRLSMVAPTSQVTVLADA
jgi:osmoprotectant transport system ATP-binding protein